MLNLPSREEFKKSYEIYATSKLKLIKERYEKVPANIGIKLQHGFSMLDGNEKTTMETGLFNESYFLSSALEGCGHDIGRFQQFLLSGTLNDVESEQFTGCKDHGNFGRKLLLVDNKKLLRFFLPEATFYDKVFTEVIGEHTNIRNLNYQYPITELKEKFLEYSLEEVLKSKNKTLKNQLIALKLMVLQETDSLELLQNIISSAWTPFVGYEEKYHAHEEVWDDFTHFRYISMKKYKVQGKWTANDGFLLRYGLLTHKMNLVGSLKQFVQTDSFRKVWERTLNTVVDREGEKRPLTDKRLYDAQEYIQIAVHNLIECSPDGILITPSSREEAKQKTLKQWGIK